ncbi:MAG: hypothetical protein ACT4O2_15195 [Beijerinckiaceae bacterium]
MEASSKKRVFAVQPPGSKKHARHVVEPSGSALEEMFERLKVRALAVGYRLPSNSEMNNQHVSGVNANPRVSLHPPRISFRYGAEVVAASGYG